jgi:uncharacterized membrane protein YgcG
MPFPFTLPTTSSFSFSSFFESSSHPSLPSSASTYRGVLRDTLKKHKRLPPQSQAPNLSSVLLSIESYLPYLFALDGGLGNQSIAGEEVDVVLKFTPTLEWRATLSASPVPGREPARQKLNSLEYELYFVLSTLAYVQTLSARAALQPLYSSATSSPSQEQRTTAITVATKHLLSAASIEFYLSSRSEALSATAPCIDITTTTFSALSSLALAEATLLFVLKDDPYPAAIAQDRNANNKEWMIKAPEIPKVRAHLFARLCLAASEHAARASTLLSTSSGAKGQSKIDDDLLKYVEDLRRTSRAKACRFFGIDAELSGETGTGIAWLQAGLQELGFPIKDSETKKGLGFSKLRKEWSEKRENQKVESGKGWGADAGRAEEARVLESLDKKWGKMNDTINTQLVPDWRPLLAAMPSGREMHTIKPYKPPSLDAGTLQAMRAPPSPNALSGAGGGGDSSDEGGEGTTVVGAFPGMGTDYAGGEGSSSAGY